MLDYNLHQISNESADSARHIKRANQKNDKINIYRMQLFVIGLLFLITCCDSCSRKSEQSYYKTPVKDLIFFNSDSIKVEGNLGEFRLSLSSEEVEDGLEVIKIKLSSDVAAKPSQFQLKWKFPSVDVFKYWNPNYNVDRVNYYYNSVTSNSTRLAPLLCFMDMNDINRFSFALEDVLNRVGFYSELIEEDANFHCAVSFFEESHPAISCYETELWIDRRPQPFYYTLKQVTEWWETNENYKPMAVPDQAKRPMYSSWYSYHQNLDIEKIVEECRQGKEIGLESVIIDDGWQTLDNQRGYAYTGDWKPERIPEMKDFVERIHALDMHFILWYSVPFIGKNADNFSRFKGKYLYEWESQGCCVLDPRYPDVREFIICTYENAQREWNLDGFKLDFIGFFRPVDSTRLSIGNGRDFASVNEAVDRLMTDIMERLQKQNPNIMIEFRQPYIGPLMRKYGNMLRASDCPNMSVINKVRTTDIRLLAGNTAVHSDMLMWHSDEAVEHAALQILNVLFAVPQISVRMNEIPFEHKEMIAFWIDYWNRNRDVLIDGDFRPQAPDALYPVITSCGDTKIITAIYQDVVIKNDFNTKPFAIDIINARKRQKTILFNDGNYGKYKYTVYNCTGEKVDEGELVLTQGAITVNIPPSGLLQLRKREG